jgi:hypothetical protein
MASIRILGREIPLPLYVKVGDKYIAVIGPVEDRADRFILISVNEKMIAAWNHQDKIDVLRDTAAGVEITEEAFQEAYDETLARIKTMATPAA